MRRFWRWILAGLAAIAAVVIWILRGRLEEAEIDAAKGRADERRKKVREQVEEGDGGGLYRDLTEGGRK